MILHWLKNMVLYICMNLSLSLINFAFHIYCSIISHIFLFSFEMFDICQFLLFFWLVSIIFLRFDS